MKILLRTKCNKTLSEERKQKLFEYRRNYYMTYDK